MNHFENLLELISIEREAEKEENKRELEKYPLQVRESLGKTVTKLVIEGEDFGIGNIPLLVLSRPALASTSQLSPFHAMNQGDNVRLTYPPQSGLDPVDGTLYEVEEFQVAVAVNVSPPDPLPKGACQLDLLGSDATYKRMRQALNLVRRSEKSDLVRLRSIFQGEMDSTYLNRARVEVCNQDLNQFQVEAVEKCLAAEDVAIIHGPPGTGKTTVLVEVILQTVKRGGRVLASAPSNIAVDNIVEKLLPWNLRIVRMGHPARTMEYLRHVTLTALEEEYNSEIEQLNEERHRLINQLKRREGRGGGLGPEARREILGQIQVLQKQAQDQEFAIRRQIVQNAQVVLSTHGGTGSMLSRHKFDLVAMDEASQATEPLSWIPITLAKKVVFAGDHCQLPPTIYSKEAAERGLSLTLFESLKASLPEEVQTLLRVQYRMHENIMAFSSQHFYENKLIADESVRLHTASELSGVTKSDLTDSPLIFLDTAGTGYEEAWNELLESRENDGEAQLALKVLEKLLLLGLLETDVGLITPYVAQVKKLRLQSRFRDVEIGSVDSFQGREKEVIILSLVRSNPTGQVGFLKDTRRMNVGMTRARRLLLVIGDSATICRHPFYKSFLDFIDAHHAHRSAWDWLGG